jgi:diaminohydroxyphosphoribosylaminopyrimidine deaminase/5-amino-6-(5-phosphoribosylamino)uracil reductase
MWDVEQDLSCMREALREGEQGRRTAAPNPWVGSVLVRDGRIVGRGFHARAGEPHAEVHALRAAGYLAQGATAYVTLEPCSHHGRTPPCADALIAAGVARVVVALPDPDPRVAGCGIHKLQAAGIPVTIGVGQPEAARALAAYVHQRSTGRAYCLLKSAVSLDGRTAAADGSSQWITGPAARADAHRYRAESQAVLVGALTALADRPALTARDVAPPVERQPTRVLLDARGIVPADGPLFDRTLAPTLVVTTEQAPVASLAAWEAAGAEVTVIGPGPGGVGVDLTDMLAVLGQQGVLQAMVEGGSTLHGALVRAGLVDELVIYVGAVSLGERGRPLLAGLGPESIGDAERWTLLDVQQLGADVRLTYLPARLPEPVD